MRVQHDSDVVSEDYAFLAVFFGTLEELLGQLAVELPHAWQIVSKFDGIWTLRNIIIYYLYNTCNLKSCNPQNTNPAPSKMHTRASIMIRKY